MDLRVLGPLELNINGATLWLGAPKQQCVLALLAVQANQVVGIEELVDELWPDRCPPASAVVNIRSYAATLRRLLAAAEGMRDRISRRGTGYLLHADPDELDLLAFREECRRGQQEAESGNHPEAATMLSDALSRWKGPMLAGLRHGPGLAARCVAAEAERIAAVEHLAALHIAMHEPHRAIPALHEHVRAQPLRESAHALLIRALHESGDIAGALSAYRRAHTTLTEELGVEPGPELRRLHYEVLNRTGSTDRSGTAGSSAATVPREIPPDIGQFVGRRAELDRIISALMSSYPGGRQRPAVVVLSGSGGVGKSALAIHAAHEVAERFPDGQVYLDLLGSSPGLRPLTPVEALRRILRSLGVPQNELPEDEAGAAGQLRSLTADGRYLFVLDNATDMYQILPLIPSSARCAVVATARQALAALDADVRIELDVLPTADGVNLLQRITGDLAIDPSTATAIVERCDHLPLAVRIAGGRLVSRPDLSPGELAARLADRAQRLDELELEGVAVRSCIGVGYEALDSGTNPRDRLAARSFRALGLLNVPDVQPGIVAAMLAEHDVHIVKAALERLVTVQLLTAVHGRYRLHDLVRLVAAERAAEDPPTVRADALGRGFAYLAGGMRRADSALRPGRSWVPDGIEVPIDVRYPHFDQPTQAKAWVEAELPNAMAAAEQAGALGPEGHRFALWLSGAIQPLLHTRNETVARYRLAMLALDAALGHSDPDVHGWVETIAGRSEADVGHGEAAVTHFRKALDVFQQAENHRGVAMALSGLGIVSLQVGDFEAALGYLTECLSYSRRHALDVHEAAILFNLGNVYAALGRWDEAQSHLERSLADWRDRDDPDGVGSAAGVLAAIHCYRDDLAVARRYVEGALACTRATGDVRRECHAMLVGSEVHLRAGDHRAAMADAEAALSLARSSRNPYSEAVALRQRAKITSATGDQAAAAELHAEAKRMLARLRVPPDPVYEVVLAS